MSVRGRVLRRSHRIVRARANELADSERGSTARAQKRLICNQLELCGEVSEHRTDGILVGDDDLSPSAKGVGLGLGQEQLHVVYLRAITRAFCPSLGVESEM